MISAIKYSKWSLKRKLFVHMLLLAVLLLLFLGLILTLFGRGESEREHYIASLEMQMEIFEKDVAAHFDNLAASAISMSHEMRGILADELQKEQISFSELSDSGDAIYAVQNAMAEPLKKRLLRTSCSGAFVMLDATVNTALQGSEVSKTGIYLQINGYNISEPEVLMYRGTYDLAAEHGLTPHRKWHMEFSSDSFPGYGELRALNTYSISEMFTLPGTSEKAVLISMPILSEDGAFLGICGFEVSESYFTTVHAQTSRLDHLGCMLSSIKDGRLITSDSLICRSDDGYFGTFAGDYAIDADSDGLCEFSDGSLTYVGVTKTVKPLEQGREYTAAVMIPKADYSRTVSKEIVRNIVFLILILFCTVSFSRFFSKRFLSPLLSALEELKSDERSGIPENIPEIADIALYLDNRDREHGEILAQLDERRKLAENEKLRLQSEYEDALSRFRRVEDEYNKAKEDLAFVKTEIERLAYSRKTEIDPDDYKFFVAGIETLTESERNIFEYYINGKSSSEILEITGIKESTLKYHNHNILGKLGVSSRKQMLRYVEVMRNQNGETQKSALTE